MDALLVHQLPGGPIRLTCLMLQGMDTYPTEREKENHRLRSAIFRGYVSFLEGNKKKQRNNMKMDGLPPNDFFFFAKEVFFGSCSILIQ